MPSGLWILPSQSVGPVRKPGTSRIVELYEYRVGGSVATYQPDESLVFRLPDPTDPYRDGLETP